MRKFVKLVPLFVALVLIFGVTVAPRQAAVAQIPPISKIYNLYATDGYYWLPDGQPLYMYGFIGGEQGKPFTYQKSCIPTKKDKVTGLKSCIQQGNVVGADPIPPTGGPIMAGEAGFAGHAQFPAPIIYATTDDVVEIRLKNLGVSANPAAPNDPHSIHLHGLDVDAANDGVPETSLGAVPANLCADGTTAAPGTQCAVPAPGAGNVIVYMFTTDHPGTYMYHCHQEADIHVQMGMFGALVIYHGSTTGPGGIADPAAATGPGQGLGGTLYGMPYDKDYVMLISEFDPRGHADEEGTYAPNSWDPKPYNWALYKPQYWSINGLSFPQTIHADIGMQTDPVTNMLVPYTHGEWLAAHPGYETLYTGNVNAASSWGTPGEKVLLRVINMGFETQPLHMHGYHGKVIGSDARGWTWGHAAFNAGLEKNTLVIGSGETYDWLVDFGQQSFASTYDTLTQGGVFSTASTESRYNAANNLPTSNTTGDTPIPEAGDPLLPEYIAGPTVAGLVNLIAAGANPRAPIDPLVGQPPQSQYFPFHNHDDYKATNNGIYPGGMFTFLVPTQ